MEPVTEYMRMRNLDYGLYLNSKAHKFELGYAYSPLPSYPKSDEEHDMLHKTHEDLLRMPICLNFSYFQRLLKKFIRLVCVVFPFQ